MEWINQKEIIDYERAVADMELRVAGIHSGAMDEAIWLVEHAPLYTAGTSAKAQDLLNPQFPVYNTGRGGQYTYHGYGQRVAYVMLNLKKHNKSPDIKKYIWQLEEWIILTLADFGIIGERRLGRVGIWVVANNGEAKIAAIGVRVRHWVTYHGIAININPDLSHFSGIIPCGIAEYGVTSFAALGVDTSMNDVDIALKKNFTKVFESYSMG